MDLSANTQFLAILAIFGKHDPFFEGKGLERKCRVDGKEGLPKVQNSARQRMRSC